MLPGKVRIPLGILLLFLFGVLGEFAATTGYSGDLRHGVYVGIVLVCIYLAWEILLSCSRFCTKLLRRFSSFRRLEEQRLEPETHNAPVHLTHAYSIHYSGSEPGTIYALDWDFSERHAWSATKKEYGDVRWFPHAETNEKMREVLLDHFGLSDLLADEFSSLDLKFVSPGYLAFERRGEEEKRGLPKKVIISDTAGFHTPADEYPLF